MNTLLLANEGVLLPPGVVRIAPRPAAAPGVDAATSDSRFFLVRAEPLEAPDPDPDTAATDDARSRGLLLAPATCWATAGDGAGAAGVGRCSRPWADRGRRCCPGPGPAAARGDGDGGAYRWGGVGCRWAGRHHQGVRVVIDRPRCGDDDGSR